MNETAAVKARVYDGETTPQGALAIDHQPELATRMGQNSASSALDSCPTSTALDVRSIVEQRFNRMNEAHDRIRSEELALRLGVNEIK
jgi:hypothetical protein